jgi:isochorismatase family protein
MPHVVTTPADLVLLLVDAQKEFLGAMCGAPEPLLLRLERLLGLANWLEVPAVVTLERPVEKKGALLERLALALAPGTPQLQKSTFDATGDGAILDALAALGRRTVAVAGAETDVCVLFSVLGLLRNGYRVLLLEDCLFTSEPDPGAALARMRAAGAVPCTFKTLAYELTSTVDRSAWPATWTERLAAHPDRFAPPEDLPPR